MSALKEKYLFRGIDVKTGDYVYGSLIALDDYNFKILSSIGENTVQVFDINPLSASIFTGFYDKNDNKLFEGDTVYIKFPCNVTVKTQINRFCDRWVFENKISRLTWNVFDVLVDERNQVFTKP